ncbi:MAG: 1-acyl-sn-glycerol-3-phosphate acyltransferase [Acidobacteriia bacterium]|nr:1-acyl-sn-glycerol-3-phosphate acyltransferase [Terriglobia bacterium]
MLRSLFLICFLTIYILLAGPPLLVYSLLVGNARLLYRAGLGGVLFAVRAVGVKIRVEGLENVPPGACLFVANHTSSADAPAVVEAIPRQVAILLKESLFRYPIVGQAFRLAKFVAVNRSNREAAISSVERATEGLRAGTSFLIYPEGTRSPDGRLQAFKKGAVVMAIKAGVPIVPVACAGAHRIMEKRKLVIHPGEIVVRFCPPIETTGFTVEQRDELNAMVRAALAAGLPPDQRPLDLQAEPQPENGNSII